MENGYRIRRVTEDDEAALWQMLFYAAHVHDEPGMTIADVMDNPGLAKYVSGWGREGDLGYLAVDIVDGQALGAVWVRLFGTDPLAYSQADADVPELAIAVLPEYIGRGLGSQLMQYLLDGAAGHYPAVVLNVRQDNPAVRLYQRLGFKVFREFVNRAGTLSYDMRFGFATT